jgi:hypothetical protein
VVVVAFSLVVLLAVFNIDRLLIER